MNASHPEWPKHKADAPAASSSAGRGEEESTFLSLHFILNLLRMHRMLIFCTVLAVVALGGLICWRAQRLYPAHAKLIIQSDISRMLKTPDPLGSYIYSDEFFQTQYRRLNSRTVLKRAIQSEKINTWPEYEGVSDLAGFLAAQIELEPIRESRMVEVSFEGPNPANAVTLVNAVVQSFQDEFYAVRHREAAGKVSSMAGSIEKTEAEMRGFEEQLRRYMKSHEIVSVEPRFNPAYVQLEEIARREAQVQADLFELEARAALIEEAAKKGQAPEALEGVGAEERFIPYDYALAELEKKRAAMLARYRADSVEVGTINRQLARIETRRKEVARQILAGVISQRDRLRESLRKLGGEKAKLKAEVQLLSRRFLEIERLRSRLKQSQDRFQEMLAGASRGEVFGRMQVNPVLVVERPVEASVPSRPKVTRNLAVSFLLGLLLGFGLAALLEFFDDSVRTPRDLELLVNIHCLTMIPQMSDLASESQRLDLFRCQPDSHAAEAFRRLRATLTLLAPSKNGGQVFLISSAQPDEGKTTTALNLAAVQALNGRKVLFVDADLRNPTNLSFLGISSEAISLRKYLISRMVLEDLPCKTQLDALDAVRSSEGERNPSEILGHRRMEALINWARAHYDLVILDTPPVLSVADALVLSPLADHALLAVRGGKTRRSDVMQARQLLLQSRVRLLGAVLNDADGYIRRALGKYGYGYKYYSKYLPRREKQEAS